MMSKTRSFFTRSFLTSRQLAKRWHMSSATLRQWKWINKGPESQKIGGRILYMREIIEAFEDALIQAHTTENGESSASIADLIAEENNKNNEE